jgi:hypothetical protein
LSSTPAVSPNPRGAAPRQGSCRLDRFFSAYFDYVWLPSEILERDPKADGSREI